MSSNIGLPFATVIAIGTLKTWFSTTLVAQMPPQGAFPHKDGRTVRTLVFCITIGNVLPFSPVETRDMNHICEHRDISACY